MKRKLKAAICLVLLGIFLCGISYRVNAEEVKTVYLSDILEEESFVRVNLGGGYLGKCAEYDIDGRKTIILPNDGANRTVIRNWDRATVFYGKYRGKDEYKDYRKYFPELDVEFFLEPIKSLGITVKEIQENDYQMQLVDEMQIENFLVSLSYVGAIDNEIFSIESIQILFDEGCRPIDVEFNIVSEWVEAERVQYMKEQLHQTYEYIAEEDFEKHFSKIQREIDLIVPLKYVEVIDYIDELSNVVKMVDEHFLLVLRGQTKELENVSGWDKPAIFAYLEAVDRRFAMFSRGYEGEQITQEEYLEQLDRVYETAHLIGSDVYTYMFESSQLSAKQKAHLVLDQMACYIDANGMLQMGVGDSFDTEMAPHSEFLEDYAECVREMYKRKNNKYKQLDNEMIHQFRMYIDKHNIEYVRTYFDGDTDYEKLLNYAKAFEFDLYYGEPSRHHNKIGTKGKFENQEYDKILTPNHLSEFIVNVKTGEFMTEWDVLKPDKANGILSSAQFYTGKTEKQEKQLVNTESFNYAPAEYVEAHQMLDVLPATPTKEKNAPSYLENKLKKMLKDLWKSPGKREYKEKYRKPADYLK